MAPVSAVLPDYEGANLTGVVPALLRPPGTRPGWLPEVLQAAEQVVLFVVDGLGWQQMSERPQLVPNLAAMAGGPITSVVPSTTATALTSLVVGAPPAAHGVVGYRVVVEGPTGDEVMNVLKWRTASGDARTFVDPLTFQVLDPFRGEPVPVVSRLEFAGTPFTETHQRGAEQVGWAQASGVGVEIRRLMDEGRPLVYAYYDGVDRVAHVHGFGAHYDAELVALDRLVGDLLEATPAGAALAVTADHGQVDVGRRAVPLDPAVAAEARMQSGEARFRWLHAADATPAGVDRLAKLAADRYGDQAWVVTFDEMAEAGWMGGPIPDAFRRRLGDVALIPFEPVAYLESADASDAVLACRHGSLTEAEMLVPLVAAAGRLGG
jgi:Type I phosphodiesterase / nucleotide pyrophosphatase